jgi:hypothetical protein
VDNLVHLVSRYDRVRFAQRIGLVPDEWQEHHSRHPRAARGPLCGRVFDPDPRSLVDLISNVEVAFQNREIKFPPTMPFAAELEEELESFQSRETAAGTTIFEKPAGKYDDLILAMSLALRIAKRGEEPTLMPDESLTVPLKGPFKPLHSDELFSLDGPLF